MINVTAYSDGALLEVHLSGEVTRDEYNDILVPAIDTALSQHDRIRMLVEFTALFERFDMGAAWADMQLGLTHWSGFDRLAVVADSGWIRNSMRLMGPLMPGPVQVFELAEIDGARRWLRESLGAVHMQDLGGGGLHLQLLGKLDPEAIENAEGDLDAHIRANDDFRLLLDLSQFDGWQGLSAIGAHFKLVREHAPLVTRAAVVGDKAWQHMAQRIVGRFLNAETKVFETSELDAAKSWLAGS